MYILPTCFQLVQWKSLEDEVIELSYESHSFGQEAQGDLALLHQHFVLHQDKKQKRKQKTYFGKYSQYMYFDTI